MPELPEVEVSKLGIQPHTEGKVIVQVKVHDKRLRWPVPDDVMQLQGRRIQQVRRRAKYLLIDTEAGSAILHLGMSGKLRVVPASTSLAKHDHIELVLETGLSLRLNDPRRFGAFLWQPADEEHKLLSTLGPEPLTSDFNAEMLYAKSRGRKSSVKTFIMDNHIVVGVGNIYANEALFASGIDPRRAAGRISRTRYERLAENIKRVLLVAIEQGGTTLRDFTRTDGQPGYFAQKLNVYGRGGEPCPVCQGKLKEVRLGQRSTVFCAACQR